MCVNINGWTHVFVLALSFCCLVFANSDCFHEGVFSKSCATAKSVFKLEIVFLKMLLGCFWICGCSTQILRKFASEAVLPLLWEFRVWDDYWIFPFWLWKREWNNRSVTFEGTAVLEREKKLCFPMAAVRRLYNSASHPGVLQKMWKNGGFFGLFQSGLCLSLFFWGVCVVGLFGFVCVVLFTSSFLLP